VLLDRHSVCMASQNGSMESDVLELNTGTNLTTDVTAYVRRFCGDRGDGLCHIFVPHATAGLAIIETGAGSESDLADAIDRFLPRDEIYRHRHGSPGHGRDHVLPAYIATSLTLTLIDREPALGTWQSVVVVDSNVDNQRRKLHLSFLPG
jgi:secondary thiamine-phosphate synthase enzyme